MVVTSSVCTKHAVFFNSGHVTAQLVMGEGKPRQIVKVFIDWS